MARHFLARRADDLLLGPGLRRLAGGDAHGAASSSSSGRSWLALRIVPIALTAVAALVVWRVGRRTIGEPAGAVAGAMFWIWPPFLIFQTVHQQGFYASESSTARSSCCSRCGSSSGRTCCGSALFGLVLGLAFWQTAQIVPIARRSIAWTIWRQPRALRHLWVALACAVVGALPWLVWNLRPRLGLADLPTATRPTRTGSGLRLADPADAVGLRAPFSQELLLPARADVASLRGAPGAVRRRRGRTRRRKHLAPLPRRRRLPLALRDLAADARLGRARYVVVLMPVLALLLAQVATSFPRAVAVLAVASPSRSVTLHRDGRLRRSAPAELRRSPRATSARWSRRSTASGSTGSTPTTGSRTGSTSTRTSASSQ